MRFSPDAGTVRGMITAAFLFAALQTLSLQRLSAQVTGAGHSDVTSSTPTLRMSPTATLKAMEPAADEEYTLGGGDEITVEVPGHPELSGKHTVGPDGRTTLPTAGTVDLQGLTREQASAKVQAAFAQYYKTISASVSIDKYGSNRVLLLGAVEHPGVMYFDQTPTLLEAITRAGLVQQSSVQATGAAAGRTSVAAMPRDCKIYRGTGEQQQVLTVDLHQLCPIRATASSLCSGKYNTLAQWRSEMTSTWPPSSARLED